MTSLARTFDQNNLVVVDKITFRRITDAIESNSFLSLTRDSTYSRDQAVEIRKNPAGVYLTVVHYSPKAIAGTGLNVNYKVDKEIYAAFSKRQNVAV